MFASGEAGGETITADTPRSEMFQKALDFVCIYLTKAMARDGEGATKRIEITVRGAASLDDAGKRHVPLHCHRCQDGRSRR